MAGKYSDASDFGPKRHLPKRKTKPKTLPNGKKAPAAPTPNTDALRKKINRKKKVSMAVSKGRVSAQKSKRAASSAASSAKKAASNFYKRLSK